VRADPAKGRSARAQVLACRAAILRDGGQLGVSRIWLVGSTARGDDQPWSDIDLFVETDNRFDHLILRERWESLLARRVDILCPEDLRTHTDPAFAGNLMEDAIALHAPGET
jgi:predicted nucleotidyltransferase